MFWHKKVPFIKQLDSQDCGFACLKMVGKYYFPTFSLQQSLIENSTLFKFGISIHDLKKNAENVGFEAHALSLNFTQVKQKLQLPAVVLWNQNHYVVIASIKKNKIEVVDPEFGRIIYTENDFLNGWKQQAEKGVVLYLEPTNLLKEYVQNNPETKTNVKDFIPYLKTYKIQFLFVGFSLLFSSIVELLFPFFTQKIIDKGVAFNNLDLIYQLLIAQLVLFFSKIGLEFYRSWLFIHISSRISFSLISNFLSKLLKLPIRFFNSKTLGDLTQRIQDHKRIEDLLTKELIQAVFATLSLCIYAAILIFFDLKIFLTVIVFTAIELLWIFIFIEKIKINDHKSFTLQAKDRNKIQEIIEGIHDVKLNNLEEQKAKQWQEIQKGIYTNQLSQLKVNQKYQSYRFFNFLQNIFCLFFAAVAVLNGNMTLGTMLSVMFILGGINLPISQLINFVLNIQLTKISFERLKDIQNYKEEEDINQNLFPDEIQDISLKNVSFSYDNTHFILKDISFTIPKNKTTAIVGVSGSGKTSLLKLILKFYTIQNGYINLGIYNLREVNTKKWREKCGVVFQDSILFSHTIKYNICLNDVVDQERYRRAVELANIKSFIESLPLKDNMRIGTEGIGLSQGQKQRLLIARAIYKNPDYLFFDEATNALDTVNERLIIENVSTYFAEKTQIIVAHRLSTVINADQIVVLDQGRVIEVGTHYDLIALKGKYFELIKNQLELV